MKILDLSIVLTVIALRVIECLSYKTLYYTKLLRFLLISASFSDYRIQSVPTSAKFNWCSSTGTIQPVPS